MKRSGPIARSSPLRSKRAARAPRERPAPVLPAPVKTTAVMGRVDRKVRAVPKQPHDENAAVMDLARGKPCLLRWQRGCLGDDGTTTVVCHENRLGAAKGMGYKAHDWRSAWGCSVCHREFDQPSPANADAATLDMVFAGAWERQLRAWRVIADNPAEKPRARAAASWALVHAAAWLEAHGRTDLLRVARGAG